MLVNLNGRIALETGEQSRHVWPWHCLLLPATVLNPINGQTNKVCPVAAADTAPVYLNDSTNHLPVPSAIPYGTGGKPMACSAHLNRMPPTPPTTLVRLRKAVRAHVSPRRPRVALGFPCAPARARGAERTTATRSRRPNWTGR
jgi:hypothetical protein